MTIYDETGVVVENPDLSAGYLEPLDTIHHEAIPAVTHEETLEFPGGSLTYTVVDTPAQAAYDEVVSYTYIVYPPNAQDDTDAMLVDHEYRLTMLELGLTE